MNATDGITRTYPPGTLPIWLNRPISILLVALAAFFSHSWMTNLEFQLDDWEQVGDAMNPSAEAVLLGKDARNKESTKGRPTFVAFFRPVLFAAMWVDVQLFGSDPRGHHASSIAYHILCTVIFYLTLLRLLPLILDKTKPRDVVFLAFTSALVFSSHPSCWGAVSWVAARGDLIATLLFLLATNALIAHRRNPAWWKVASIFLCLILALGAKEGSIMGGPILAVLDFFVLRKRGPNLKPWNSWLLAIPFCLMMPAYMLFRVWMFGPDANLYAGHVRVVTGSILRRCIEDFFWSFHQVVSGHFYYLRNSAADNFQFFSSFLLLTMIGVWVMRRPVRRSLGIIFLFGLYTLACAPTMRFYREASGFDASRLFYLPFVFMSVVIAIPLQLLFARLKFLRWAALFWLIVSLANWCMSGYESYSDQIRAAKTIARVRQDVRALSHTQEAENTAYVIFKLPTEIGNVPLYGTYLRQAFTKNFTDRPLTVTSTWSENLKWELRAGNLHAYEHPIRFLEWKDDERDIGHLVPMTDVLPGPIGYKPTLDFPQDSNVLRFDPKIHPRDIQSLRLNFNEAPKKKFSFKLIFHDSNSAFETETTWSNPKLYGTADHLYMHFVEQADWLFQGALERVEFKAVSGSPPKIASIEFGREMPKIITTIPNDAKYSVEGDGPEIRFKEIDRCEWYRCRVFMGLKERTWTFPRNFLPQYENGEIGFPLHKGGVFPHEYEIRWEDLKVNSVSQLDLMGLTQLVFRYKIEGLIGAIENSAPPQRASEEATFTITR